MRSALTDVYMASPHHRGYRISQIDRITIHCTVGQCTAEALGYWFQLAEIHSANYGVDRDGRILCAVDEDRISICSSSYANDMRAVTIEVASDAEHPYAVTPAAMQSLIRLVVDICRRNGKIRVVWIPDKFRALSYDQQEDEMLLTVHRWFTNTLCPGEYLMEHMGEISTVSTELLTEEDGQMEKRFQAVDDCPTWARPTVRKLIRNGSLRGNELGLDLSSDMLRLLVINDREGLYDHVDVSSVD